MDLHRQLRVLLLIALSAVALAAGAPGAVFEVTKTTDDNGPCDPADCALREAILAANALPGMDTVELPPGEYQLALPNPEGGGGRLLIRDDVEILGVPGQTTIIGNQDRVFLIVGFLNVRDINVRLQGLVITGGSGVDSGGGVGFSVADVKIVECSIEGNSAIFEGGGVLVSLGTLTLLRSTISNNHAGFNGGGIRRLGVGGQVQYSTSVFIINSTVSANSAGINGGGMYSSGGNGEIRFENATVVGNSAEVFGSLIFQRNSIGPQFLNSVLDGDCFFVSSQFPMSLGGNVGGPDNAFCFLDQPSDQPDLPDLGLLPLGNYGGTTLTHDLSPTSPAIDSALNASCPASDQRGRPRPIDGDFDGQADCDAGAVEFQVISSVPVPALSGGGLLIFAALLAAVAAMRLSYR